MKGKLYLFGIGGTGSRVIKSLIMLAAAGVRMDADAIVPIIVDPDFANADVTRAIRQMEAYASVHAQLAFNDATKNHFFRTPIENIVDNYRLELKDTKNKKFGDFIAYSTLSKENQALASMLFSYANLESDMEEGFKGNPNIGSVVLNQFTESQDFQNFAASFNPGDRIFIVSSIFGGTGASGFPLLLKNLRGLSNAMPNYDAIQKAPIGAITVLPYFDVKPDAESAINSSTFSSKSKAALKYYENNVTGDQSSVNVLYYIGDDRTSQYENVEGGDGQKDSAHVVELAAAMAAIDFMSVADGDAALSCQSDANGRVYAPNPLFKEFGIKDDVPEILLTNLSDETRALLSVPVTGFVLFAKYMREHLRSALSCTWAKDNGIDDAFLRSPFVGNLQLLYDAYWEWLEEMAGNDRSFKPYKLSVKGSDLYAIVDGIKPSSIKELWAFNKSGYDLFDAALNKYCSLSGGLTREQKFVELFYIVTKELVERKFKF